MDNKDTRKSGGGRNLKVGELLRHTLAEMFLRGDTHIPELEGAYITVSEVRISPDLRNATVFIMPLGGRGKDVVMKALAENASHIRRLLAGRIELRFMPMLHYKLDESFEAAGRVNELLNSPSIIKDLQPKDQEES